MTDIDRFIANKKRVKLKKRPGVDPGYVVWEVFFDGKMVGEVCRTGEYGRDTYPWGWLTAEGVKEVKLHLGARCEATRKDAISKLVDVTTGEMVWY